MFKSLIVLTAVASSVSAFSPSARPFGVRTSLSAEAEEWTPSDGMKWEDKNWEGKLDKLQKDAEKRMEEKIDELMSNVAASGAAEN